MTIEIDGKHVKAVRDFHAVLIDALGLPLHYGKNLDALFDTLSANVERPLTLVWKNSAISKEGMGDSFDQIMNVLQRIERQDAEWGLEEKFVVRMI